MSTTNTLSRRSLLSLPKKGTFYKSQNIPNSTSAGLEKYRGQWDIDGAAHLYRRTTLGATGLQIKEAATKSLDEVMDVLFVTLSLPSEPINFRYDNDPEVPIGETWANKPITRSSAANAIGAYRRTSLEVWQTNLLISSELNIREQMTLFWHNHFVTEMQTVRDATFIYNYITKLRENATGNFKTLTQLMTIDPAMLRYLNGNQNTNRAPNENYARELLELFTLGRGESAGPGDYTTFTETDVIEVAKILTGWRDFGYNSVDGNPAGSTFVAARHETGSKQLSHRFNDAIISNQGEDEYKTLIDLIFQKEEAASFICRKLYRWFVYYDINDDVEANIISPMATMLRESNYEIMPVLRTLLSSEHFFNICSVGPMIKNPITFFVNLFRQNEVSLPSEDDMVERHDMVWRIYRRLNIDDMVYFNPPGVAGWKAYYQEPLFYRIWISSVTLRRRQNLTDSIASGNLRYQGFIVTVDLLDYISTFSDPFDPENLIKEFVTNLFPQSITEQQVAFLKEILIPGLPDFEWTVEYGNYIASPTDEDTRQSVDAKLRNFFSALIKMPEYYLS